MAVAESVVGSGAYTYDVLEEWAQIPDGWNMPAAAVTVGGGLDTLSGTFAVEQQTVSWGGTVTLLGLSNGRAVVGSGGAAVTVTNANGALVALGTGIAGYVSGTALAGGTGFSEHAYGTAIDVNPVENPYVKGTTVLPAAGRAFTDRSPAPGVVRDGDAVVEAFARQGFGWGVVDPGHGLVFARADRALDAVAAAALSAHGSYGPLLLVGGAQRLDAELEQYLLDIRPGYRSDPVRGVYNHGWIVGDDRALGLAAQARIDELLEITPVTDPAAQQRQSP